MKVKSLYFKNNTNGEGHRVHTREEWLVRLEDALRPSFQLIGYPIPNQVRVTCGWPSKAALSRSRRRVGECWPPTASADQTVEIFISPCLGEGVEAAKALVHEMVHATGAMGHRGKFPKIAKAIGLRKPWRATQASPELQARLNALIAKLGPYPHATLDVSMMPHKKDGTRLQKVVCADCGYTIRTTKLWIEKGLPTCPCGTRMENAARIL